MGDGHLANIIDIATTSEDFNILAALLGAADLVETVRNANDITVFAPTDAAFGQLAVDLGFTGDAGDESAVIGFLTAALTDLGGGDPIPLLTDILTYHVSPGAKTAAEVDAADQIETLLTGGFIGSEGRELIDNEPDVANPNIVIEDQLADNGIIQVIDRVLLPIDIPGNEPPPNIVDIAAGSEDFEILVALLGEANLVETVRDSEDITVFAPTDAAFGQLAVDLGFTGDAGDEGAVLGFLVGALTDLGGGEPIPLLTDILTYHVSPGAKTAAEVDAADQIETLLTGGFIGSEGRELIDNEPDVFNPNIVIPDIPAANGTIQAIDRVLLPIDIPGNGPQTVVIEAEDMDLSGYRVEHDRDASGDELIKLAGRKGTASTIFEGRDGKYDLELHYFDEIDGRAKIDVLVNGERIERIKLDEYLGGRTATAGNLTAVTIEGLHLEQGDEITLVGIRNGFELARIDKLTITPSGPPPNIVDIAAGSEDFEILVALLGEANLVETVRNADDITVFAPTDAAFGQLAVDLGFTGDAGDEGAVLGFLVGALTDLGGGEPIPLLTDILTYHVSPGAKTAAEVDAADQIETLLTGGFFGSEGTELIDNEPDVFNPNIVIPDIAAANGTIQAIDRVLLPIDIPGNGPRTFVIEAEEMDLSGYRVEHDRDASGDELIKLAGRKGTASTIFEGRDGKYDLELHYFDEIDGRAKIDVLVNGERIERIKLDEYLGGRTATEKNLTSVTIEGLHLEQGDEISFLGIRNGFELARIDKLTITPSAPPPAPVAGEADENGDLAGLIADFEGDEVVLGTDGADRLAGGDGDSLLVGGRGPDAFLFDPSNPNEGHDLIADFNLAEGDAVVLRLDDILDADPDLAEAAGDHDELEPQDFDADPDWTVTESPDGNLVVGHPGGSIELQGVQVSPASDDISKLVALNAIQVDVS